MRKLVVTTAIMLSTVLLLATGGKKAISSASPTQILLSTSPKPTPIPYFATGQPVMCTEQNRGYSWDTLKIAQEQRKGLMTIEIETRRTDGTLVITPENTPVLTPTISPAEELLPDTQTSQPVISPTVQPTDTPSAGSSGGLNAEVLFAMVNQTRASAGLPAFQKHPDVCSIAYSRAPEIENEIYGNSYIHAGFRTKNIPFWASENMISQQTEQEALNWWLNSPVHRSAILGSDTYACTVCSGKTCAMIFSSLEPKASN